MLPVILSRLIASRAAVKGQLKALQGAMKAGQSQMHNVQLNIRVLDARQRALKIATNAIYGFTGATTSPLYVSALANTVLRLGTFFYAAILNSWISGPLLWRMRQA